MKIVGVREAQKRLGGLIDSSQEEAVVLTRHGRPTAVLRGVGGRRAEDVIVEEGGKFWGEIEAARNDRRPLVSHEEVKRMFGVDEEKKKKRR
mgnify:CR=1 FL=1